jgi:hypothetical protein
MSSPAIHSDKVHDCLTFQVFKHSRRAMTDREMMSRLNRAQCLENQRCSDEKQPGLGQVVVGVEGCRGSLICVSSPAQFHSSQTWLAPLDAQNQGFQACDLSQQCWSRNSNGPKNIICGKVCCRKPTHLWHKDGRGEAAVKTSTLVGHPWRPRVPSMREDRWCGYKVTLPVNLD